VARDGTVLDTLVIVDVDYGQLLPDAAFNGSLFLVAWEDHRREPCQVYFSRMMPDNTVLDPGGVRLAGQDSTAGGQLPAVATNGTDFLVAWIRSGTIGSTVFAARVGADGRVLDSVPLCFTPDSLFQNRVAVASDGRDYIVAWHCETPGPPGDDVLFCRVAADGRKLDSVPRLLCRDPRGLSDPQVAWLDGRYLVSWAAPLDDEDVIACRVLADGTILDPGGFRVCGREGAQRQAAVAAGSDRFLIAWSDSYEGDWDIFGTAVDTLGAVGLARPRAAPTQPRLSCLPCPARRHVSFGLPPGASGVEVRDAAGRLVTRLDGRGAIEWQLTAAGHRIPAGTYFARTGNGPLSRFTVLSALPR
jgi:hypothetical protein